MVTVSRASSQRAGEVFVGRGSELALLRAEVARVRAGATRVVALEGEAGIGKSALLRRLVGELSGFTVLRGGGEEGEAELDFGLVDQLVADVARGGPAVAGWLLRVSSLSGLRWR